MEKIDKLGKTPTNDVVIRFSGDSGDGMQLTGTLFSETVALGGNAISTFPDYPAEIRAPQGTIAGVSGFQVHFGSSSIATPGDQCDILVAMNPAALKANRPFLKKEATIIYDTDTFTADNLRRAGFVGDNPFEELSLQGYNTAGIRITTITREALTETSLDNKSRNKCRNMFALGVCLYLTDATTDHAQEYLDKKFGSRNPDLAHANMLVIEAGYNYAANNHLSLNRYYIEHTGLAAGKYRTINGNTATAWGLIAASERSGLPLFCGSYPITPATGILEELAKHKSLGVKTMQAEDEIAGICTAIGASFAGSLAVTTTSGPGLALKSEALGLAVMSELPLVVVDVQRGGPSTGLPTKTEQSDLMQALYGRNGESPLPVIAASTPSNCFHYAFEAARIAVEHMTPVVLLTDGFIANSSEAWAIPSVEKMRSITPQFATLPSERADHTTEAFMPYARDERFVRRWAVPGMQGLEHRIGGLEKDSKSGDISYNPENHMQMVETRARKVEAIADYIPMQTFIGSSEGRLLVVGWGGTMGHLRTAVETLRAEGKSVSHCHFNYINPLPHGTKEILEGFERVVVCELNGGQFADYLRSRFPDVEILEYAKCTGQPFSTSELTTVFNTLLEEKND